jgi:hypothetical protein
LKSGVSTVTVSGLHRAATIDTNFKSLGLSQFALFRYTWNKAVTKRVLACIIRLSKSRNSQVNWKKLQTNPHPTQTWFGSQAFNPRKLIREKILLKIHVIVLGSIEAVRSEKWGGEAANTEIANVRSGPG